MSHILDILGFSFLTVYAYIEVAKPDLLNEWIKFGLGFVGFIFVIIRILLTYEKWRGQRLRNKMDRNDSKEKD